MLDAMELLGVEGDCACTLQNLVKTTGSAYTALRTAPRTLCLKRQMSTTVRGVEGRFNVGIDAIQATLVPSQCRVSS